MTAPDLAAGLTAYLEQLWGTPVKVGGLTASTAGARRANMAFEAQPESGEARRLVATIVPTAAIQLNPVSVEAAVRILAFERGVAVPEVVGWTEDSSWVGGPFFLSQHIDGETVPRQVLRVVEQRGIGDLVAAQLGEAMARLHAIDPDDAPDGLMTRPPGPPAETALEGLAAALDGLLEPRPALSFGLRWLERHLPSPPARRCILHTDIRNGNIIVGPDGLRAILDWEGSRRGGDPMEDLAWLGVRMWRFRNDEREIGGMADRAPLVAAYDRAGGRFDEDRYRWWKVYGTLKWAVGLASQAGQHLDGSFRSIVMAASGRRVPELEWDLLMLIGRDVRGLRHSG